jgi:uncharacterized membrane protein
MKSAFAVLLVLSLAAFTGCDKSTPGGPGAGADQKKPLYGEADNTFDLSVPSNLPYKSTTVKQGETANVSISVKRGKSFDQDVTLKFEGLPTGVTVEPASPVIKHGDKEAKLVFTATDDAALGDFTVKVKGTPTKGGDASNEFKVTVDKKATFVLSVPLLSTTLKQGETKAFSITIQWDKTFNQDVTLKFDDLPKGVTVEPASPVLKHGDIEAKLTLKAADDAPPGDTTVKVTGHPTKGADASNEFKVTVNKK